jgi:hypothetical protein
MTDLAAETDVDSRLRRLVDWALGDDVLAGPDVGQAVLVVTDTLAPVLGAVAEPRSRRSPRRHRTSAGRALDRQLLEGRWRPACCWYPGPPTARNCRSPAQTAVTAASHGDTLVELRKTWDGTLIVNPTVPMGLRRTDRDHAGHWLALGADLISFGRAFIGNPTWSNDSARAYRSPRTTRTPGTRAAMPATSTTRPTSTPPHDQVARDPPLTPPPLGPVTITRSLATGRQGR